jgi:ribosome modulation factor
MDFSDAYALGVRAGLNGEAKSANIYEDGTVDHTLWGAGWREGNRRMAEGLAA